MKRIVICLDGTWNDKRTGPYRTNVARICDAVAPADTMGVKQDAHYIEGIATKGSRKWLTFLMGGVGAGVSDRIRAAYECLAKEYEAGDEVFIFGFSRGAFQARSLAGFVSLVGIARRGGDFSFDTAWQLYRQSAPKRGAQALAAVRGAAHYPARIKCVGVWDTVGNIGNPLFSSGWLGRRHSYHDIGLNDAVSVGLHALCIDEVRGPFRPALWTLGPGEELAPGQHVEQVWMPGVHADVGGGYRETQLSDIGLTWMMERVSATTGLALDMKRLPVAPHPDALGPQHASATGTIFKWSGVLPFIRLVNQNVEAIPSWRRSLLGAWRTGKLRDGRVPVNEKVHPSAQERFGRDVIELDGSHGRRIAYEPANLSAALPARHAPQEKPSADKPRRVRIFTVHGTFAREAEWDNWNDDDAARKADPKTDRTFPNRLAEALAAQRVSFDKADLTQYNWSGGNSHEERRIAAIGLKKTIEAELTKAYEKHGRDYYDAVYVIGHSHGGTVARLAMNLWDKDAGYYSEPTSWDDPTHLEAHKKALLFDDECPTCRTQRNGLVAANSVPRPTGVITFGSPFVTFEKRGGGLLTVNIAVWLYRILAIIPVGILVWWLFGSKDPPKLEPGAAVTTEQLSTIHTAIEWLWPLAFYWFVTTYFLGSTVRRRIESWLGRWLGEGARTHVAAALLPLVKYGVMAFLAVYYVAYIVGGWELAVVWMPFLKSWKDWSLATTAGALFWVLIVTLPGRFRSWMKNKVQGLKDLLPAKYDPVEDKPVRYLSYHTLGDEAGVHLRAFGSITWLVQTLALASACVLAFGLFLAVYVGIEALLNSQKWTGILTRLAGVSAFSDTPGGQQSFVEFIDRLTKWPAIVWHHVFGLSPDWKLNLGDLDNPRAVVGSYPSALATVIAIVGFGIMPLVLMLVGIAYLVSIRLRGSGLVFGSESAAWTMANRIAATARPNDNTIMRKMFISPEAWWKQEMAHCYYYKSDRVIADVAAHIADWNKYAPSRVWSFERTLAGTLRWLVVAFCVASLFAFAVPMAESFAKPSPVSPAPQCKGGPHAVSTELSMPLGQEIDGPVALFLMAQTKAQTQWATDVNAKEGADWSKTANARNPKTNASGGHFACIAEPGQAPLQFKCRFEAIPCLAPPAPAPQPKAAPASSEPARR